MPLDNRHFVFIPGAETTDLRAFSRKCVHVSVDTDNDIMIHNVNCKRVNIRNGESARTEEVGIVILFITGRRVRYMNTRESCVAAAERIAVCDDASHLVIRIYGSARTER